MTIQSSSTVGAIAAALPGASRVFETHRIDYCCGGTRTLADACALAGVPVATVIESLEHAAAPPLAESRDWRTAPLAELTRFVVDTHHVFTKDELERLEPLTAKVSTVHGARHPELREMRALFEALTEELIPHMMKEEQILFPFVETLERAAAAGVLVPPPPFGTVGNPIRMMLREHDVAGDLLRQMRAATKDYALPADACGSYRALYERLEALERDLHQHIHLESNVLFPRALSLESRSST